MVSPLSLDPGRSNPRSPNFNGCTRCGGSSPPGARYCRTCKRKEQQEERQVRHFDDALQRINRAGNEPVATGEPDLRTVRGPNCEEARPSHPPDEVLREREPDPPVVADILREMDDRPEGEALAVVQPDTGE